MLLCSIKIHLIKVRKVINLFISYVLDLQILILEELQFRMVIIKSKPNRDKTQSDSLKKATKLL